MGPHRCFNGALEPGNFTSGPTVLRKYPSMYVCTYIVVPCAPSYEEDPSPRRVHLSGRPRFPGLIVPYSNAALVVTERKCSPVGVEEDK